MSQTRTEEKGKEVEEQEVMEVFALDEDTTARVISLTSPVDACRIAAVSTTFKAASESDAVWEHFLPCGYRDIILHSSEPSLLTSSLSKKHLYISLCHRPILIEDGLKSFSLEKSSGKTCYMLSARDLTITWAETVRYWNWKSEEKSRFEDVALLINVCWLEIRGEISKRILSPRTSYVAYFVYKLTRGARGFQGQEMDAEIGIAGGEMVRREVYLARRLHIMTGERHAGLRMLSLAADDASLAAPESADDDSWPERREDGWMEVKIGEFCNDDNNEDEVLEMCVKEVTRLSWKSGLVIEGIEIRPKRD